MSEMQQRSFDAIKVAAAAQFASIEITRNFSQLLAGGSSSMFTRSSSVSNMTELTTSFAFKLLEQQFAYAKQITDILVPAPKAKALTTAATVLPVNASTDGAPEAVSTVQLAIVDTPVSADPAEPMDSAGSAMAAPEPDELVAAPAADLSVTMPFPVEATSVAPNVAEAFVATPIETAPAAPPPTADAERVEPVAASSINEISRIETVRADEVVPTKSAPLTATPSKTPMSSANASMKPKGPVGRAPQKRKR